MSTTEVARPSVVGRIVGFYDEVMVEMRKVTWPDVGQLRQATLVSIILVLFIGAVIGLLDVVLQQVLVKLIPSLFGGA
jgi:preprotein translocase subunit SecE